MGLGASAWALFLIVLTNSPSVETAVVGVGPIERMFTYGVERCMVATTLGPLLAVALPKYISAFELIPPNSIELGAPGVNVLG